MTTVEVSKEDVVVAPEPQDVNMTATESAAAEAKETVTEEGSSHADEDIKAKVVKQGEHEFYVKIPRIYFERCYS
jgi:hypothetical protein